MVPKPNRDCNWQMTEDSGAFKTNRPISNTVPPIVMSKSRTVALKPHRTGKSAPDSAQILPPAIFSKRRGSLTLSSVEPDSLRAHRAVDTGASVLTAFPAVQ
jgi:hypothetical protein